MSPPHFLHGDPALIDAIEGLFPRIDSHDTYIMLEKHSGVPMDLHKRIQFNVEIYGSENVDALKEAEPLVFPLMWIDENSIIDDDNYDDYKHDIVKPVR